MDKRVVLAVAGSGKTYYIANDFKEEQRALLISFTHANLDNIRNELRKRFHGKIPSTVEVMTFDSFVYTHLIRPLEPFSQFGNIASTGVEVYLQPETNPRNYKKYIKQDKKEHYLTLSRKFYVIRLSKFFNKQDSNFKDKALYRLMKFFDVIYFDEFQDYTGESFKLLKYLLEKSPLNIVAVGDIYQSNVAPIRNDGSGSSAPYNKIHTAEELKKKISKCVEFDEKSLVKSRRVPPEICELISKNIGISIDSCSNSQGEVVFLNEMELISEVMNDEKIPKFIWNKKTMTDSLQGVIKTWSYVKGDTYEDTCVILTESTSQLERWQGLNRGTTNKLYVALTRAKRTLYLIDAGTYKKWCDERKS